MDTNKMREEFIRAYRVMIIKTDMNVQRRHFELQDGEFVDRQTAIAWWAWQSSREAVVVELPKFDDYPASMERDMRESLRSAIEAQGLKVSP